ncbi:transporter substrate-binding domain-containing protein [Pigmentibacter sp. JX0631]|uniref:transporter substrate-binding domain-containing protein n=1 Tax=Pigmentibacter sp. JX0631 TaxID=2976982 RepID=UPI0024691E07|nr:transporter substrate-binding domain-containing protein [Pigmentibacter sp. JX0631]WGL58763.1 transporter substrate-binding domain-containing protein [Pigmentibacter sp. JX0631]
MNASFRKLFLHAFFLLSTIPSFHLNAFAANSDENKKEDVSLQKIKTEKVLKVCSDAGFLPFEMKTQKGDWIGFDVEMMKEFAKTLSVELKMIQISFDGIIPALISAKCDIIAAGMTVTAERKAMVLFSDSTFTSGLSIAIKNNEKNKNEFKDLNSLDKVGLKIAVKTGYTSDIYLSKTLKKAQILKFDQDADLVLAVMQGRANAFVSDTTYVDLMDKGNKNKFIILPTKVVAESFSIAAKKDDTVLISKFNSFLKQWKENGGYEKARKYYFVDQVWRSQVAN